MSFWPLYFLTGVAPTIAIPAMAKFTLWIGAPIPNAPKGIIPLLGETAAGLARRAFPEGWLMLAYECEYLEPNEIVDGISEFQVGAPPSSEK